MLRQLNVPIPRNQGFMTPWMIFELGVTMFLISYAADMMSLFLSSISRTTTGAMTLMPFILIFQLVFSGGVIPLPEWSKPISNFTISNYGIKAIASQSGYDELPMTTVWTTVSGMRNSEVGGTFTLGELLDKLDNPAIERQRDKEVMKAYSLGEVIDILNGADSTLHLREIQVGTETLGEVMDQVRGDASLSAEQVSGEVTLGQVVDFLKENETLQGMRDKTFTLKTTVGDVLDLFGEENVKEFVQRKTAEAAYKPEYERSVSNIAKNWAMLGVFILVFAMLSTIVLEMIDKDKR